MLKKVLTALLFGMVLAVVGQINIMKQAEAADVWVYTDETPYNKFDYYIRTETIRDDRGVRDHDMDFSVVVAVVNKNGEYRMVSFGFIGKNNRVMAYTRTGGDWSRSNEPVSSAVWQSLRPYVYNFPTWWD